MVDETLNATSELNRLSELHFDEPTILRDRRVVIEKQYNQRRQEAATYGTKQLQRELDAIGAIINGHLQGDRVERGALLFVEAAMSIKKDTLRSGNIRSVQTGGWEDTDANNWNEEMMGIAKALHTRMDFVSRELQHSGDLGLLPKADELNFALRYARETRLKDHSHEANTQGRLDVLKSALGVAGVSPKRTTRGA